MGDHTSQKLIRVTSSNINLLCYIGDFVFEIRERVKLIHGASEHEGNAA